MKKLNRKGFTLVELLAVIVILAIVVGIALTTVLPTLKKSRQEAFLLTANTAADYFEKQYSLYLIDENTYDFATKGVSGDMGAEEYKAAGLKATNYKSGTWSIDEGTGRACVHLVAATRANNGDNAGEYYDVADDTADSNGCD
jgi:prepilin-type N-terminal cleavage/methylation domain-containing protein